MSYPTLTVIDEFIPAVRSRLAKLLADAGNTQIAIADTLGISQTMVSRYLKMELPSLGLELERDVEEFAKTLSGYMLAGNNERAKIAVSCRFCLELDETKKNGGLESVKGTQICFTLSLDGGLTERQEAYRDIQEAIARLEGTRFLLLFPEVGMNLSRCCDGARGPEDVASVPGRLSELRGRILALSPPEFGASNHLTTILLTVRKKCPEWKALVNVKCNKQVELALKKAKLSTGYFDRERMGKLQDEAILEDKIASTFLEGVECVADRGDFGIEPCLYILGTSAVDAVGKAEKILDLMD